MQLIGLVALYNFILNPWIAACCIILILSSIQFGHGLIVSTTSIELGGKKAAATATGFIDGAQYLVGSTVGYGIGKWLDIHKVISQLHKVEAQRSARCCEAGTESCDTEILARGPANENWRCRYSLIKHLIGQECHVAVIGNSRVMMRQHRTGEGFDFREPGWRHIQRFPSHAYRLDAATDTGVLVEIYRVFHGGVLLWGTRKRPHLKC